MQNKKKLVLVDGSSYLYRAFHALPPLTGPDGQQTGVIYGVSNMLNALIVQEKPDYFGVVFDAKEKTFRHDMYPEYKAQRPPMPPDLVSQIKPLFELIKILGYPLVQVSGVEADDVIGTLAQQAAAQGYEVVISTGDKDLMQLVCDGVSLYNTMKKERFDRQGVKNKLGVFPEQVIDYLTLMGDQSDNIPGVKGVGAKTAVKWLDKYTTLDNLLARRGEIKTKVAQNLQDSIDKLPLFRDLVTIKTGLMLDVSVNELQFDTVDKESLARKYEDLGFQKLLQTFAAEKPKYKNHYALILDSKTLSQWIKDLRQEKCFVVKLETAESNYMRAEIIGMTFVTESGRAAYVPVGHDYMGVPVQIPQDELLKAVKPLLEDETIKKGGHDLKYMRNVLANYDIVLRGFAYDSMLESYLYNSAVTPHSVGHLAGKYLDTEVVSYEEIVGKGRQKRTFSQIALKTTCHYSCGVAETGMRLHQFFSEKLSVLDEQRKLYEQIEIPLLPVLSDIERKGVRIAPDILENQNKELSIKIKAFEDLAYKEAGQTFNLDSPSQIRDILFDELGLPVIKKTPKGEPSTAEDVLQEIAYEYKLPRLILDYRSLKKLQSTYTNKLPQMIVPETGRIHTSYHQAATLTGRLSSSDPNLQNIPIRSDEGRRIRQAFIAADGYCLIAADYSQIELRIMAHFSGDTRLREAFEADLDIHAVTAAEVFGVPLEQVTPSQRRSAKTINFGLIYSISSFGLAKQLKTSRESAQEYLRIYFERYPEIQTYMTAMKQVALKQGYVETLLGRRIYLPDIQVPRRKLHAQRVAINAPIQGTAADIVKQAMINLHSRLQEMNVSADIVMQVHDELVLEVAEENVDAISEQCNQIMTSVASLEVPLVVDIGCGKNWDEAH